VDCPLCTSYPSPAWLMVVAVMAEKRPRLSAVLDDGYTSSPSFLPGFSAMPTLPAGHANALW
jgi:hypothetical protein